MLLFFIALVCTLEDHRVGLYAIAHVIYLGVKMARYVQRGAPASSNERANVISTMRLLGEVGLHVGYVTVIALLGWTRVIDQTPALLLIAACTEAQLRAATA